MGNVSGPRYLKEMTWQEVDQSDRRRTVIMFPAGPIEQHGPQAPLGTDLYIAEYVMMHCANHLTQNGYTVLIAPAVSYVNALFSMEYPGSVSIRRKVVEEYFYDLLASFAMNGFIHLVLVSQHMDPPWVRAAEAACERVNQEYQVRSIHGFERMVYDVLVQKQLPELEKLDLQGDSHAGVYETAPMLYIDERLVRQEYLEQLPPVKVDFSEMKQAKSFRELADGLGYTGNLSQVNKEIGKLIIEHYASRFQQLIFRHVKGEDVYSSLKCSHLLI